MVALFWLYTLLLLLLIWLCSLRERRHYEAQCEKLQKQNKLLKFGSAACSPSYYSNLFLQPREIYPRDLWDKYFEDKGILLLPRLSVSRVLSLAGRLTGLREGGRRKDALLKLLRLERVQNRELRFLSQGDQKKAVLGMELMAPCSNLIL